MDGWSKSTRQPLDEKDSASQTSERALESFKKHSVNLEMEKSSIFFSQIRNATRGNFKTFEFKFPVFVCFKKNVVAAEDVTSTAEGPPALLICESQS